MAALVSNEAGGVEPAARAACERGQLDLAATLVLEAYTCELYSFLLAQFRGDSSKADEVFSQFKEDLWRGLPGFGWRCSMRAWCYKLLRSAASRFRRSAHHRRHRLISLSDASELGAASIPRTTTQPHLRSEVKDQFQRLREELSPQEQDLLILRVDRSLSWRDIAHAMTTGEAPDEDHMRRFEAALRQRFSEVKRKLRRLAREAGLLDP